MAEDWAEGNAQYRRGNYREAIVSYSNALLAGSQDGAEAAIVLGNRAACHLALSHFAEAEADARSALALDATCEKHYYRLFTALKGLSRTEEAAVVLASGLAVIPGSKVFLKLQAQLVGSVVATKAVNKKKALGVFEKQTWDDERRESAAMVSEGAMIIETAPGASYTATEHGMIKEVRSLIRQIQRGELGSNGLDSHRLSGVFKTLCERQTLLDTLYPGVPPQHLQQLPQNLRDVLMWRELILDLTSIAKSAASVLEGIKKRAAATGDYLDPEGEQVLGKQIAQEALAREVVTSVSRLSKQMSKVGARISLSLASPDCDKARADRLDDGVAECLMDTKVAFQADFLGSDWAALVLGDLVRFAQHERMSEVSNTAGTKMAYIDLNNGTLEEFYPALAEAVSQLQSLPYELNAKLDSKLKLLEPTKGCTVVLWYPRGSFQKMRLDNTESLLSDSGIRLTCSYHVVVPAAPEPVAAPVCHFDYLYAAPTSSSSSTSFSNSSSVTVGGEEEETLSPRRIEVMHDELILHQSVEVKNQRSAATQEYFSLMLLVHAQAT